MHKCSVMSLFLSVFTLLPDLAAEPVPIATVVAVQGQPKIQRGPLSGQGGQNAKAEVGAQLFLADRVQTAADEHLMLRFDDEFEVAVDESTELRLTPGLHKTVKGEQGTRWVRLVTGALRARRSSSDKAVETGFRSRSMVMGVRGTEFVFLVDDQGSQLVALKGELAVRALSGKQAKAFDTQAAAAGDQKSQKTNSDSDEGEWQDLVAGRTAFVMHPTTEAAEALDISRNAYEDLQRAQAIIAGLPWESKSPEPGALSLRNDEEGASESSEASAENTDSEDGFEAFDAAEDAIIPFRLQAALATTNYGLSNDLRLGGDLVSLGIRIEPSPSVFFEMEFLSGTWRVSDEPSAGILGRRELKSVGKVYNNLHLMIGYLWPLGESFEASAGLGFLDRNRLLLSDVSSAGEASLQVDIDPSVALSLGLRAQLTEHISSFLSLRAGSSRATVKARTGATNKETLRATVLAARLGVAWGL